MMNNDMFYTYIMYIYICIIHDFIYMYMAIPFAEEKIQVPGSRCKQDLGMEIDVMTFDWIASISSTGEIPQPSHTTGDLFCI